MRFAVLLFAALCLTPVAGANADTFDPQPLLDRAEAAANAAVACTWAYAGPTSGNVGDLLDAQDDPTLAFALAQGGSTLKAGLDSVDPTGVYAGATLDNALAYYDAVNAGNHVGGTTTLALDQAEDTEPYAGGEGEIATQYAQETSINAKPFTDATTKNVLAFATAQDDPTVAYALCLTRV